MISLHSFGCLLILFKLIHQVLVTGSLHLMGDMLKFVKKWGAGPLEVPYIHTYIYTYTYIYIYIYIFGQLKPMVVLTPKGKKKKIVL